VRIERALVNEIVALGLPCFRVPLSGANGPAIFTSRCSAAPVVWK
jgi:hypothetical protein